MFFGKLFRQSSTCRITIPLQMRKALKIFPGDMVVIENVREGVLEVRNATREFGYIKLAGDK